MDRTIEIKVGGNYITKDSKVAGVVGESNAANLRITFDECWDGFAKKVTFWNATGETHVIINLAIPPLNVLVESTRIYIIPIPGEAMDETGELTFVIDGYIDGKRQRSIQDNLEVKDAPFINDPNEPSLPTPDQAEQLQTQIENILGDMQQIANEAENSQEMAETAQLNAAIAQTLAERAQHNAETAQTAAETAQTASKTAQHGAEMAEANAISAKEAAETAQQSAETAKTEAEEARDDILDMTVSAKQLLPKDSPTVTKTQQGGVVNLHFGIPDGEKGEKGEKGDKGDKGDTGDSGVYIGTEQPADPDVGVWIDPSGEESDIRGASAYEVAVENGFEGTEEEWLASLKGEKGEVGDNKVSVSDGNVYVDNEGQVIELSKNGHSHSALDITDGTLSITRGGTGTTTKDGILSSLFPTQTTAPTLIAGFGNQWENGSYCTVEALRKAMGLPKIIVGTYEGTDQTGTLNRTNIYINEEVTIIAVILESFDIDRSTSHHLYGYSWFSSPGGGETIVDFVCDAEATEENRINTYGYTYRYVLICSER